MAVVYGADQKVLVYSQAVAVCQHNHLVKCVVADHQEQAD
jgi:hypothetical protein